MQQVLTTVSRIMLHTTFWTSQPHVWFAQNEVHYEIKKIIADDNTYYYDLSVLDAGTANRLLYLINYHPPGTKYSVLTNWPIDTFGLSEK